MEIYTDTAKQRAILVCDETEFAYIEHALFSYAKKWLDKSNAEEETWKADLDLGIAKKAMELCEQISEKLDQSKPGEYKIL